MAEFGPTCFWTQTSAESHFTRSLTCSLLTRDGRITLSGDKLITTTGGDRVEEKLPDDAAILAAYRDIFGFELDRLPVPPAG